MERPKYRLGAASAVCAAGILFFAQSGGSAAEPGSPASGERPPEFIYDRTCGYCHGHNVGPILKGRELPAESIEYFVRHGNGAMPAFKPTEITPSELAALARWISDAPADPQEKGR
ncbi:mono/diheme cytochrome c family protein [Altererythrobacter atlanticus]|uniref:4-cresol dehydrogenase [hydroxylating] cytochrome c subunit n=1 Tax=Croceibacterium atlanticum TaxID=1267766 RepID=A0A0F7KUT8_9SPHN|nr:cytochrome c [Croceibacterium atlanticum]AKH44128.1 4-cresol dehydrogenase [hydroxylating] cytochrome c subunit precursor [Croceibacterium atlanticum]MBB5732438.1 mono/diheme cytochrome c family protein [Croceibacterium atlanticum]